MEKIASQYVLLNLFAMAVVVVLFCVCVKYGLDIYTHHGEGIDVPELKGMTYHKARLLLEEEGLNIVVSDSGFQRHYLQTVFLLRRQGLVRRSSPVILFT